MSRLLSARASWMRAAMISGVPGAAASLRQSSMRGVASWPERFKW